MDQSQLKAVEPKPQNKNKNKRKNRRANLVNSLAAQELQKYNIPKMDMGQIASYIKQSNDNQQKVYEAVADLNKKVSISRGSLNAFAKNKSHLNNYKEMKAKLIELGIDVNALPKPIRTSVLSLIALDDWSDIKKDFFSAIKLYGPQVLHFLISKYLGGDEGYNSIDSQRGPMRQINAFAPRVNQSGVSLIQFGKPENVNHVSKSSICSVLMPECYLNRVTPMAMSKTALGRAMVQISASTNASGNGGVVIYPEYAVAATGLGEFSSFVKIFNAANFDPSTATQTGVPQLYPGPFNASLNGMSTRVTQVIVEIQPSVSFNTPGVVSCAYYIRSTGGNPPSSTMDVKFGDIRNQPYSFSGGVHNLYRVMTPFTRMTDLDLSTTPALGADSFDGFQIYFTGCGGVVTFNLMITVLVEFVPTASLLSICPMDYPEPGPLTLQFLTEMFARYPAVWNLVRADAERITSLIAQCPVSDYNALMDVIGNGLTGITMAANYASLAPCAELDDLSLAD